MGNKGPYHWDEKKSELAKIEHGKTIAEICNLVFYNKNTIWEFFDNPNYPNQYRIIASTQQNGFVTVAVEEIKDSYGNFTKLITWWPSSPKEKRKFINAK